MRNGFAASLAAAMTLIVAAPAAAEMVAEVEGIRFPTTMVVEGKTLVLNGAAARKRGYFKPDVVGLYLQTRANSLDSVVRMPGPKRVRVVILKELTGATISRYFVNDFKLVSTEAEFKSLINEIAHVGSIYATIPRLVKGDVVDIDWVPGKGELATHNGKSLGLQVTNELMFHMTLRMAMGPAAPEDMREQLLGLRPTPMVEAGSAPATATATTAAAAPPRPAP